MPARCATHASVRRAVAAHLGDTTVRVAQHHRAVCAVGARLDGDETVGTDAEVAIAERGRVRRRERRRRAGRGDGDEEVVPGGLELRELERSLHQHHHDSSAGSTAHEFSGAPNQVMRGSRRNQTRWRRGERPGAPHGGVQGGVQARFLAVEVGQDLLVADGLAGGTGPAVRVGCERPDLVDQPRGAHGREPVRDPVAEHRARDPDPRHRDREHGGAVLLEAGAERGERSTRGLDHLERADDPAGVGRFDARRRVRVEPLELAVRVGKPVRGGGAGGRARLAGPGPLRESGDRRRRTARRDRCRRAATPACHAPRCRRPRRAPRPWNRATDQSSEGSATSMRWCGTAASLGRRRLRGADVHAPVDLHRVDGDDLDVAQCAGRLQSERGLPRRGGADEREVHDPPRFRGAYPAVTGMRMRRGGAAVVTSTSSPRSQ